MKTQLSRWPSWSCRWSSDSSSGPLGHCWKCSCRCPPWPCWRSLARCSARWRSRPSADRTTKTKIWVRSPRPWISPSQINTSFVWILHGPVRAGWCVCRPASKPRWPRWCTGSRPDWAGGRGPVSRPWGRRTGPPPPSSHWCGGWFGSWGDPCCPGWCRSKRRNQSSLDTNIDRDTHKWIYNFQWMWTVVLTSGLTLGEIWSGKTRQGFQRRPRRCRRGRPLTAASVCSREDVKLESKQ